MKASAPPGLAFLKLGGSLLGNKAKPRSYRGKAVERLGAEIKRALAKAPGMKLLLAHGGGGPAHEPAKRFRTRDGLRGRGGWPGFSETRRGVLEMSRRVLATLSRARCFPILISPCAGLIADGGVIAAWDVTVIRAVLSNGQVPLIHGDAVLDRRRGFAIVSTEELFAFLASRLRPKRIVLACDVDGVYLEHPGRGRRPQAVKVVDRHNWPGITMGRYRRNGGQSRALVRTGPTLREYRGANCLRSRSGCR